MTVAAARNWAMIGSGETFESLATTLVYFEDSAAALFGRRGPDGGQDVRSGDGKLVYQAKHHVGGSAADAIRDAKGEAANVLTYRTEGHRRAPEWKNVTHWRLVTNVGFGPADKQRWAAEVVPLFAEQGLVADYWEVENLNGLLAKHPEVDRAFFGGEPRAFLSPPEFGALMISQERFLRRTSLGAFVGRHIELQKVDALLESTEQFLLIHGPGGIGKTRLLVEAGESIAGEGRW